MADVLQSAVAFQLHWTLVPQTQETERQVANIGSQAFSCQYQRVMGISAIQAARLAKHGQVCLPAGCEGYDLEDDMIDDRPAPIALGMPCLVGLELMAYLGIEESAEGEIHRLKVVGAASDSGARLVPRRAVLPLPTEGARVGDWVLPVELPQAERRFLGCTGLCLEHLEKEHGKDFMLVAFPSTCPQVPPELVQLPPEKLVSLPSKHTDVLTPLEAQILKQREVQEELKKAALPGATEPDAELELESGDSCTCQSSEDEEEAEAPEKRRRLEDG
ncbi:unnamed protein product [Effrenium voratum]|nr:unnamed protein product [Effrenium voratum]